MSPPSGRLVLRNVTRPPAEANCGLWFDKYLAGQENRETSFRALIEQCAAIGEPSLYEAYFRRWQETLDAMGVTPYAATVQGRLALGLGQASVIETVVSLHHTFGVPVLRGSALKGVAATYAHRYLNGVWRKGGEPHETLFGTTDAAGFVTFFDALPLPGTWRLAPDVMTVHHPDYYQDKNRPPADWDSPNPISFLTVTGSYLVALHAPDAPAWAEAGYGILRQALAEAGLGAKTSSGYGRLHLHADPLPPPFKLREGVLVRAKVVDVADDIIELELREKYAAAIPEGKEEVYIYMRPGDRTYRVGQGARCIVVSVYEDEFEFTVECRPATRAERQQ